MPEACSFEGCGRRPHGNGMCNTHYKQAKRGEPLTAFQARVKGASCDFPGCDRPRNGRGLCDTHYKQDVGGGVLRPIALKGLNPSCSFIGCGKVSLAKGLCEAHYAQQRRGSALHPVSPPEPLTSCRAQGCTRMSIARGMCKAHYDQHARGEPLTPIQFHAKSTRRGMHGWYWLRVLWNAAARGLVVDMLEEEAQHLLVEQGHKCALSGVTLLVGKKGAQTGSLDRRDGAVGYKVENVQWVHKSVNRMKGTQSDEGFRLWCQAVTLGGVDPRKLCSYTGCGRPGAARGWCYTHGVQTRNGGHPTPHLQTHTPVVRERDVPAWYWKGIGVGAVSRGLTLTLTREDAWAIFEAQEGRCKLSSIPLVMGTSAHDASLDRIDSTKGYIPGNVQWVHKALNRMKGTLQDSEFREWCRLVTAHPAEEDIAVPALAIGTIR